MDNEDNIKQIADVTLLCGAKVLLVKYKDTNKYDHQKGWFLPDDLINQNEAPEIAAHRILMEQLGIREITSVVLNHKESFQGKDHSQHVVYHFLCESSVIPDTHLSVEIKEEKWFCIDELPDEKEIAHNGWAKYTIDKIISDLEEDEDK